MTAAEEQVIRVLLRVAGAAFHAMDDSEDTGAEHHINVSRSDADSLNAALDELEALPDDRPGYTLGPASKAEWALRNLIPVKD